VVGGAVGAVGGGVGGVVGAVGVVGGGVGVVGAVGGGVGVVGAVGGGVGAVGGVGGVGGAVGGGVGGVAIRTRYVVDDFARNVMLTDIRIPIQPDTLILERDTLDSWIIDSVQGSTVLIVRVIDGLRRNVARDTIDELYS